MSKIKYPDDWSGWRVINSKVDFSINDLTYLAERKAYLETLPQFFEQEDKSKVIRSREGSRLLKDLSSLTSNRNIFNWGCGSGKTSKMKMFCAMTNIPTLVVVKTNEEIDKFIFDVKALNPTKSIVGCYTGLDSNFELKKDLEYLTQFDVLVINYWRFLNDPQGLWLNYKPKKLNAIQMYLGRNSGIREFILIDELPDLYKEIHIDHRRLFFNLALKGYNFINKNLIQGLSKDMFLTLNEVNDVIEEIKNDTDLVYDCFGMPSNFVDNLQKERLLADLIPVATDFLYNIYLNQGKPIKDYDKSYKSISQIPETVKIVIFDATAKYIFQNSEWKIYEDYETKAKLRSINFLPFQFFRFKERVSGKALLEKFDDSIRPVIDFIESRPNNKHLVVIWKDLNLKSNVKFESGIQSKTLDCMTRFDFLAKSKITNYNLISYRSGKTRGTNEFQDHDTIIFVGDWFNNSLALQKMSEVIKGEVDEVNYSVAEVAQAIFRTQARQGKPIDLVFFHSTKAKENLWDIVKGKILLEVCEYGSSVKRYSILEKATNGVRSDLATDITKLLSMYLDKGIFELENETLQISLDELYDLIPKSDKKRRSYDNLVSKLKEKLNLTLQIC